MPVIDLNADVGEWDVEPPGPEVELLKIVTSANVACGVHAGNDAVMRATVRLAAISGVAVGAHPGFDDRANFGRRDLDIPLAHAYELVRGQIEALLRVATDQGICLRHVKPHGALYNMAVRQRALAEVIAAATASFAADLALVGLSGSELIAAGARAGLRTISEVFADRAYLGNGTLAPRSTEGAVIHDPDRVAERAARMAVEHHVVATDGTRVSVNPETICIHGDTPGAALLARRVRAALERAGLTVSSGE